MEIFHIPKMAKGAPIARLTLSPSAVGRIEAIFVIERAMSSSRNQNFYDTAEQAEDAAKAAALQSGAACLIIEDRC